MASSYCISWATLSPTTLIAAFAIHHNNTMAFSTPSRSLTLCLGQGNSQRKSLPWTVLYIYTNKLQTDFPKHSISQCDKGPEPYYTFVLASGLPFWGTRTISPPKSAAPPDDVGHFDSLEDTSASYNAAFQQST